MLAGQFCSGCSLFGGFTDPRNLAAGVEDASEQICREYAGSSFDELAARWFPSPDREEVLLQFRGFASELAPGTRPENLQLLGVIGTTATWFTRAHGDSILGFRTIDMDLHLSWVLKGDRWHVDGVGWVTHDEGWRLTDPDNR